MLRTDMVYLVSQQIEEKRADSLQLTSMASVHSLPPEIVLVVLRLCSKIAEEGLIQRLVDRSVDMELDPADYEESPPAGWWRPYAWITVTHVCRAWRHIALADSTIWAHVSITRPELTAEMLKRAGHDVPLTITCWVEDQAEVNDSEFYLRTGIARAFIAVHIARIRALVVPAIANFLSPTQAAAAVQLRTLIFVEPGSTDYVDDIEPYPFAALTRLETTAQLYSPFTHFFAPTLRALVLRYHRVSFEDAYGPEYIIAAKELVQFLPNMPLLEVLDVDLRDDAGSEPVEAALPRLRTLRMVGWTAACAVLLRCLRIPRDVRVELECLDKFRGGQGQQTGEVTHDVLLSVALDPSRVDTSRFEHPRTVSVAYEEDSWRIRAWRGRWDLDTKAPPDAVIVLPMRANEHDILTVLAACPLWSLEVLQVATLDWPRFPATTDFAHALVTLPRLRTLVLDRCPMDSAWDLVTHTAAKEIVFIDTWFSASGKDYGHALDANLRLGARDIYVPWAIADSSMYPQELTTPMCSESCSIS